MNNLDLIMECYDRELNDLHNLRDLIDRNSRRVEELVSKTKNDIRTAENIN